MVKRNKTIAILLIIVLTAAVSMNVISYAFFTIESNAKQANTMGTAFKPMSLDENVIGVSNYSELIDAVTDVKYNNPDNISDKRMTAALNGDIYLLSDLIINADINVDFNGFTVFTNGFKFEVNHFYSGVFNLYNGTVSGVNVNETLRISTPNAYVATETLKLENIAIEILNVGADRIFDAATTLVAEALTGGKRISSLESDTALNKNRYCALHDVAAENNNCRYIYKDLELPKYLGASGASISYISSAPNVITASGKVNSTGIVGFETVTLQAAIEFNGASRVYDFTVHVYDAETNAADTVAVYDAVERLETYYYKGELTGIGYAELFNIPEPVLVMRYSETNGKEVKYETLDANQNVLDSTILLKGDNFAKPQIDAERGYLLSVTDNVKFLRISSISGDFQRVLSVNGQNSETVNDNYVKALKIAKSLYGDEIVITEQRRDIELGSDGGKNYVNGYSSTKLTTDTTEYSAKYGVNTISYSLLNNIDATYTLGVGNDLLQIKNPNYAPNEIQNVTLKMRFEFATEPIIVSVNIPIRYDPQTEGDGNNIAKFLPYYNYFDRLLLSITGGSVFESFEMPFGYGVDGAVYYYEVYNENGTVNNELLNIVLKYSLNQTDYEISVSDAVALDAAAIREIMLSGTGKWRITFNADKLPLYDTQIKLRYRYKFYDYGSVWYGDDTTPYESVLNVKGVVKPSDLPDKNLYKYVYDCSRPNKYAPEYVENTGMLIVTSWLDKKFINGNKVSEIDLSQGIINDAGAVGSNGKTVTSVKGLEYVKNLDKLNLASSGILTPADADVIGKMSGLIELNLADNGLYDRSEGTLGLPSGGNNQFITKLKDLTKLEKLHLENNAFYYFTGLDGLRALKDVCVFGNYHTSSVGAFTSLLNALYGTDGMLNRSLYGKLSSAGVIVRNISENEGFSQLADNDVIEKIESIEYQRKLPTGVPIEKAYEGLSLNPRDYGIENMGNSAWWGSQKDDLIEFWVTGDSATATVFTVCYKYYYLYGLFQSQEIVLEVEMEVMRY